MSWDWPGILTHWSLEFVGAATMAGLMFYARYHVHHSGLAHRVAHSLKAQFALDLAFALVIAVISIQILHL